MPELTDKLETYRYDNGIVDLFAKATIFWGIVGMFVGIWVALEIFIPGANLGLAQTTFGRMRPVHTNAVIFAFVGNAIFLGVYHSVPRLCRTELYSRTLALVHFWGWQLIILIGAITYLLGYTQTHEYAELEWPLDIAVVIIWVIFGVNMMGTLLQRREKHLYVAIWFYISTWITVAVLYIINNLALPVSLMKSYTIFPGVQDALVQWWYGHNAVAFFLTTPFLGLMYYYMPKAANRPVFSYRLSIIHFWALIFIYIWAGPHHLLYTSLPPWLQSLGTVFSIMLIAPSWGGALNGLLTLRGAWHKLREQPELRFMVVAVTAYAMATLEGPTLALKTVNSISHYTDWTIAHVHVGTLGWNGFLTFGMLYWLIPQIYKTELASKKWANVHFWIGTLGIIFYVVPLWVAAWTQGLMWKQFTPEGVLAYPNFLEITLQIVPFHVVRAIGGILYLTGVIIMFFNLAFTMHKGKLEKYVTMTAPAGYRAEAKKGYFHYALESRAITFTVLALVAILIGSMIELVPMWTIKSNVPTISSVKPYTPLELEGRDVYIREGCLGCHSQQIRPFRDEVERYGEYSKAGEFVYDHPFLWGSKRTGPDLAREGGKYPDAWHYGHMKDPPSMSPGSIMPPFPWLIDTKYSVDDIPGKIKAMRKLGVPYPEGYEDVAPHDMRSQAEVISRTLEESGMKAAWDSDIVALTAYLQRLGTDIKNVPEGEVPIR